MLGLRAVQDDNLERTSSTLSRNGCEVGREISPANLQYHSYNELSEKEDIAKDPCNFREMLRLNKTSGCLSNLPSTERSILDFMQRPYAVEELHC